SPDLFLCYGTGWAAVRSYLLGKIAEGNTQPVAVLAHAESPGGHYDLLLQNNLVELAPENFHSTHSWQRQRPSPIWHAPSLPRRHCRAANDSNRQSCASGLGSLAVEST